MPARPGKAVKIIKFLSAISLLMMILSTGVKMLFFDNGLSRFDPNSESARIITVRRGIRKSTSLIQGPAGFEMDKTYPLVIALHGWTKDKNYYFRPREEEDKDSQEYPCFYVAPNNTTEGWDGRADWVREMITELIDAFPVDTDRIYIIGFSMGGSGSFAFAEALYRDCGVTPAAILRCAGMSRPALPEPLLSQTALWYNAGSRDTLEGVYETFRDSEEYYSANTDTERAEDAELISYKDREVNRTTITLAERKGGKEKYRFSLYSPMGHEYGPVFSSDDVYEWLFRQSLTND